ncbi:hypothetical protein CEP52_001523 [Fusarium oligoseptatum]|uniref:Uncharacterized protein n=1 Tax=Fusarium oligoseptatum TaxID=2604345 RepID=A0A428UI62_9HYPO|nr:hypothetical protein CEP52_001523 [Fusarium oligoseptatum]
MIKLQKLDDSCQQLQNDNDGLSASGHVFSFLDLCLFRLKSFLFHTCKFLSNQTQTSPVSNNPQTLIHVRDMN